jgi:hypothetical protein
LAKGIEAEMKLAERWEVVSDWLNTDLKARRIDAVLLVFGILCVSYYAYFDGLGGAMIGALMYIMMVMIAVWML